MCLLTPVPFHSLRSARSPLSATFFTACSGTSNGTPQMIIDRKSSKSRLFPCLPTTHQASLDFRDSHRGCQVGLGSRRRSTTSVPSVDDFPGRASLARPPGPCEASTDESLPGAAWQIFLSVGPIPPSMPSIGLAAAPSALICKFMIFLGLL
jgi:hypothetical protein